MGLGCLVQGRRLAYKLLRVFYVQDEEAKTPSKKKKKKQEENGSEVSEFCFSVIIIFPWSVIKNFMHHHQTCHVVISL